MKIRVLLTAIIALVAFGLVACGDGDRAATRDAENGEEVAQAEETADTEDDNDGFDVSSLEDGWYRAEEEFDGDADWRNIVMIEVSGGEIVDARWTPASKTGGPDKYEYSEAGDYGMERVSQWPWHEQADAVVEHLISTQDPFDIEFNEDGEADAISGATITVDYFFELAQEALSGSPDGFGQYEDGVYRGEADPGDDWHDAVHLTVRDGYIISVYWAPEPMGDQGMNKYEYSEEGEYGMESASEWPWHEHADAVARHVIENQSLEGSDDADAVTGATISLGGFYAAASDAIAQAQ